MNNKVKQVPGCPGTADSSKRFACAMHHNEMVRRPSCQKKSFKLQSPRPTGGSIILFKPDVDLATQESILGDISGSDVQSFKAEARHLPEEADGLGAAILQNTNIGFISEKMGVTENLGTRTQLMEDDRVLSVRPEFYLFALETYQDDDQKTWSVDAVGAWTS